ncbi:hypothetical protein THASP1DRAFT_5969, partial [Thamnocephalis sphaerospora]
IMLCYHDVVLRHRDLNTLQPGEWLNDTCIEFYYEYLEREVIRSDAILLMRPLMVHMVAQHADPYQFIEVLPPRLNERKMVFLPINNHTRGDTVGGTHWSLMVYIRSTNTFYYYDSLNDYNLPMARQTAEKMARVLCTGPQPPRFLMMKTPQQENSNDCGVYVISITELLCARL